MLVWKQCSRIASLSQQLTRAPSHCGRISALIVAARSSSWRADGLSRTVVSPVPVRPPAPILAPVVLSGQAPARCNSHFFLITSVTVNGRSSLRLGRLDTVAQRWLFLQKSRQMNDAG